MGDMVFIYLSLLAQVMARIISLLLCFSAQSNFQIWFPVLILIHFIFVAIIKGVFGMEGYVSGKHSKLVTVLNVAASSLVYVRIMPLETDSYTLVRNLRTNEVTNEEMEMVNFNSPGVSGKLAQNVVQPHRSTFLVQVLFFLLVLVENVFLAAFPLIKGGHNRGLACFGENVGYGILIVVVLCIMSWVFQALNYKCMHPWKEINGPSIDSGCKYYCCGDVRTCFAKD